VPPPVTIMFRPARSCGLNMAVSCFKRRLPV
jgi:hypothetical protein